MKHDTDERARSETCHWYRGDDPSVAGLPLQVVAAGRSLWGAGDGFCRHHTPFWGLEFVVSGKAEFEQDGARHVAGSDDVFILRRASANSYGPAHGCTLVKTYLQIRGLAADQVFSAAGLGTVDLVPSVASAEVAGMFDELVSLLAGATPGYGLEASQRAYRLICVLGASRQRVAGPLEEVLGWIEQNLHRPLSSSECAKRAGVSVVHLNRVFRAQQGVSVKSYVQRRKIALASHLLAETDLSVKQVGYRVGYTDPLYFSARFRAVSGTTAREYRRVARQQAESERPNVRETWAAGSIFARDGTHHWAARGAHKRAPLAVDGT